MRNATAVYQRQLPKPLHIRTVASDKHHEKPSDLVGWLIPWVLSTARCSSCPLVNRCFNRVLCAERTRIALGAELRKSKQMPPPLPETTATRGPMALIADAVPTLLIPALSMATSMASASSTPHGQRRRRICQPRRRPVDGKYSSCLDMAPRCPTKAPDRKLDSHQNSYGSEEHAHQWPSTTSVRRS